MATKTVAPEKVFVILTLDAETKTFKSVMTKSFASKEGAQAYLDGLKPMHKKGKVFKIQATDLQ